MGKGSRQRPTDRKAYEAGWDRAFWKRMDAGLTTTLEPFRRAGMMDCRLAGEIQDEMRRLVSEQEGRDAATET